MEKPPFQFGLKAVFKAITAFAILLGIATAAPLLPSLLVAIAALCFPFVLFGFLCNKVAITLMDSAPHKPPDA
jgi:hypothetical protein